MFIIEDRQDNLRFQMLLAPLYRTPMTKEAGQALRRYTDRVERQIAALTPWRKSGTLLREQLIRTGVKPGEISVILGPGEDASDPLFEGSKIIKGHG